jgi:hypothetical protein
MALPFVIRGSDMVGNKVALLVILLVGCGHPTETSIAGNVIVDGHPLQEGYITFFPVEGTESTCGAKVLQGKYHIARISPGRWRVVISGTPNAQVKNSDQGVATLTFSTSPNSVSASARGNQQVIAVQPGTQTKDFELQNSKR